MKKKILIILGNPHKDSFCGALAKSYRDGATDVGAEVREIVVGDLQFDPVLHHGYRGIQDLEPDLVGNNAGLAQGLSRSNISSGFCVQISREFRMVG